MLKNELDIFLEEVLDNVNIIIYGKSIKLSDFEKRYYKALSNWTINIVKSYLNKEAISINQFQTIISNENFIEIVKISEFYSDVVPFSKCKEIFEIMLKTNQYPWEIICDMGLLNKQEFDIKEIISESFKNNPSQLEKYKSGNKNMKNFFIGDIMKNYKNKINTVELWNELQIILNQ